ncbi:hypothetical protein [Thermogladius sp.]|uniref:hypothetical protein n=1 Tax=Thermogladius sp. TaxID=2023064 RepID=UPI003D0AB0F8
MTDINIQVVFESSVGGPFTRAFSGRITRRSGALVFELGDLVLKSRHSIRVEYENSAAGYYKLVASGWLRIGPFEIPIPCLIAVGEPCYRVQVLIPGLDEELDVEPGVYGSTLSVSWDLAEGSGYHKLYVRIRGREVSPGKVYNRT